MRVAFVRNAHITGLIRFPALRWPVPPQLSGPVFPPSATHSQILGASASEGLFRLRKPKPGPVSRIAQVAAASGQWEVFIQNTGHGEAFHVRRHLPGSPGPGELRS